MTNNIHYQVPDPNRHQKYSVVFCLYSNSIHTSHHDGSQVRFYKRQQIKNLSLSKISAAIYLWCGVVMCEMCVLVPMYCSMYSKHGKHGKTW